VDFLPHSAIGTGVLALVVALGLYFRVKSVPEGNEQMARIARYIREGAMAFLVREYKVLAIYAAVVFLALCVALSPEASRSSRARSSRCSPASSA
jgi:K(+)-stimulated pyrophosphate-energized sodium pump